MVVRTPPEVSLYHRFENDLFARVLAAPAGRPARTACSRSCCCAWAPSARSSQRCRRLRGARARDRRAVADRHADLVISAGGTMNREAVALGTPVYTHIRRAARGRRRAPDRRRPPAQAARRGRAGPVQARSRAAPASACGAIRGSSSTCSCRRCWWPTGRSRGPCSGRTICTMRRRIRSAALPLHRRSLPQLAVDGALVALAYYLAFQLRFNSGPPRDYSQLREPTIWWVLARQPAGAGARRASTSAAGATRASATTRRSSRAVVAIVLLAVVAIAIVRPVDRYVPIEGVARSAATCA